MCRYCCWQPLPGLFFKPSLIRSWLLMVIWETAHFLFVIYTAKCFQLLSSSAQFLSVCPSLCPLDKYHPPSFLSISHPNHAYTFFCAKPVYTCLPLCFYFFMFPFFSKFKIKFSIAESKIKINQSYKDIVENYQWTSPIVFLLSTDMTQCRYFWVELVIRI